MLDYVLAPPRLGPFRHMQRCNRLVDGILFRAFINRACSEVEDTRAPPWALWALLYLSNIPGACARRPLLRSPDPATFGFPDDVTKKNAHLLLRHRRYFGVAGVGDVPTMGGN